VAVLLTGIQPTRGTIDERPTAVATFEQPTGDNTAVQHSPLVALLFVKPTGGTIAVFPPLAGIRLYSP
jgi:hypothetical protein